MICVLIFSSTFPTLSDEYRDFLLSNDGGYPSRDGWLDDRFGGAAVQEFPYLSTGDLLSTIELYRGRIPDDLIPVAEDMGGSKICIGVRGEPRGKVYFWEHETEHEDDGSAFYDNVFELTHSFQAFLDGLVGPEV